MPLPIPLHCPIDSNIIQTGTGFVVRNGDVFWLTTCVHVITNLKATPVHTSLLSGKELRVAGSPITIPVFTSDANRVRISRDDSDGTFWDVISLRLTPQEATVLASFGTYEASSIADAKVGDHVSIHGFPNLGMTAAPHSTLDATVTQVVGATMALSKPAAHGYSGSPVVQGQKLVGIAFGDLGSDPDLTSALVLLLSLFAPHHYEVKIF